MSVMTAMTQLKLVNVKRLKPVTRWNSWSRRAMRYIKMVIMKQPWIGGVSWSSVDCKKLSTDLFCSKSANLRCQKKTSLDWNTCSMLALHIQLSVQGNVTYIVFWPTTIHSGSRLHPLCHNDVIPTSKPSNIDVALLMAPEGLESSNLC